jgi:hypothetical protein
VFEETALGSLGFLRVAEQHHQIAGGPEVPRAQGSFGWLLEWPVVWLGHSDHLSAVAMNPLGGPAPQRGIRPTNTMMAVIDNSS